MLNNELLDIDDLAKRLLAGSCSYDELVAAAAAAIDVIPVAWEKAVFSAEPTHSLLRYFHYHLEGIRKISDTLYLTSAFFAANPAGEAYRFFQLRLIALTDHLKDNFQPYFSEEISAPYAYHEAMVTALENPYRQLTGSLEKLNIPVALKTCLLDYFAVMMASGSGARFTFSALFYFELVLIKIFTATAESGSKDASRHICEFLVGLNFNHLGFLSFKIQSITAELGSLPSSNKLEALRSMLWELKWVPPCQKAYDPSWPSLNTMLAGWITEEISLTEAALRDPAPQAGHFKLPLNLSVAHLACLLRLFYEESLIPNTSLTDMFKFVSRSYKSKRQDNISAASLSKEFYGISQVTAAVTRDMLQKMIVRINRSFFPVWAAAYLIIYACPKIG